MNTKRTIVLSLLLLLVGAAAPGSMPAAANTTCDFTVPGSLTIQQALNAATAGDTVCILAGTHVGPLVLPNVDDLTVVGAGSDQTIIDANGQSTRGIDAEYSPSAWNSGLTLVGLTITGSAQYGLKVAWVEGAAFIDVRAVDNHRTGIDINIVNDVFLGDVAALENGGNGIAVRNADGVIIAGATVSGNAWGGLAFYAPNAETVQNVRVFDVSFSDEGKGIYFQYDGYSNIVIEHNRFLGNGLGVSVESHPTFGSPDASGITIRDNDFSGNGYGVSNTGTGTLDAVGNYWGSPTGPAVLGDPVQGDVDYVLWCPLPGC